MDGRRIESVEMNERRTAYLAAIALVATFGLLLSPGCASGPDTEDEASDDVVGAPPDEESEDHEFALPPQHPGEYGELRGEESAAESTASTTSDPDVIARHQIERLQEFGPPGVLQHVETEPVRDNGEFVGFELVDVSETAREHVEPKLEIGDVITHVNLVRLEQPDDYMEAWETLEHADQIRIDVVRDGEAREVIWNIE